MSLSHDINILYPEFYDKIVAKVKYLFYNDLTLYERRYFDLLNTHRDIANIAEPKIEENNKDDSQSLCVICYKNNRNVLFDCYHLVLCFECVLVLSKMDLIKCPICRKDAKWSSKIRYINTDFSCMSYECPYKSNVCFSPCNHLYFCSKCYLEHDIKECLCGTRVDNACHVMFG
jgi:hypothetical protein